MDTNQCLRYNFAKPIIFHLNSSLFIIPFDFDSDSEINLIEQLSMLLLINKYLVSGTYETEFEAKHFLCEAEFEVFIFGYETEYGYLYAAAMIQ